MIGSTPGYNRRCTAAWHRSDNASDSASDRKFFPARNPRPFLATGPKDLYIGGYNDNGSDPLSGVYRRYRR